jgi:hypothetical protein
LQSKENGFYAHAHPKTMEETPQMIKFLCDSCGKDISQKVLDSVKQFCERSYFKRRELPGTAGGRGKQTTHRSGAAEQVHVQIQLLNELSKLIHASAWGMSKASMQCSSCAGEYAEMKKARVITIFTRVAQEQYAGMPH